MRKEIYIAEPVRRAIIDWMSGVEAERYQLWRKTAADWIVSRLRSAGRSGRWRYMADLLHLLEQPTLRNAFFPPEEEVHPVELARAGDFDQMFDIAELRDGPTNAPALKSGLSACRTAFLLQGARGAKCWPSIYLHARTIRIPGSILSTLCLPRGRLIWQRTRSEAKSCSSASYRQGSVERIARAVLHARLT